MNPFGEPVQLPEMHSRAECSPQEDVDIVRRALEGLKSGGEGLLRFHQPQPTAAFSRRDTTSPHYAAAAAAMRELGFQPVERPAGGHLAIYDQSTLIIDLVAPHSHPREHIHERFKLFSNSIASALSSLGVDARIGELAGEYCPGSSSVNGKGRTKLAGLAQRVVKHGYYLGTVISVSRSEPSKIAIAAAYDILGISFDSRTFGAITDFVDVQSLEAVYETVQNSIMATLSSATFCAKTRCVV